MRVEKALRDRGYTVRRSREPGGCPISEKIRTLLLDVADTGMDDITEAMLYAAARAQHVRQVVILPALQEGDVVLCDRFVDSSVAFQGGGRELGVALIEQINAPAIEGCLPDATIYLRLDHETGRANAVQTLLRWIVSSRKRRPSMRAWRRRMKSWPCVMPSALSALMRRASPKRLQMIFCRRSSRACRRRGWLKCGLW